jgi:hypothetical protein
MNVSGTIASFPLVADHSISEEVSATASHRRISYRAGRALKLVGHAIEHLSSEFDGDENIFAANEARLQAVALLMKLNHQIYFECPVAPKRSNRVHSLIDSTVAYLSNLDAG